HYAKPDGSRFPMDECSVYKALRGMVTHRFSGEVFWRKDGSKFPVEYTSSPLIEHGEIIGAVVVFQDVTERMESNEVLKLQFTRIELLNQIARGIAGRNDLNSIFNIVLKYLYDKLPVEYGVIFLLEPNNNKILLSVDTNPKSKFAIGTIPSTDGSLSLQSQSMGGCSKAEVCYVPDFSEDTRPISRDLSKKGAGSGVSVPILLEEKVFGVLFVIREKVNAFSQGEIEFLKMVCEHVAMAVHQANLYNNLKSAYNDIRATQISVAQQERLGALGMMASGIVHDINNALSPIVAYSDMILADEVNISERAKEQLKSIQLASDDIQNIMGRIRDFYRKRDASERLFPENLNQLALQSIELTRPRWRDIAQRRGVTIEVKTEFDPKLPEISGINTEIREALTNLILNSVDAMETSGEIRIKTFEKIGKIFLEVIDTGKGMNEETIKKCFDPFFTTKGAKGTGMGLPVVYGIMQRHDGKIQVESKPGEGTTIRLAFPVVKKNNLPDLVPPAPNSSVKALRILCIDDEPMLRVLLKSMLESEGHQVEVADGGKEGLELFRGSNARKQPFDIVFTDLGMPYIDGREVARSVKEISPSTPIVMLTGWTSGLEQETAIPNHVTHVINKPPKRQELRDILEKVVRDFEKTSVQ
ncbi:response regulator, partial [bacterium]|nr:response regulator [bacterium]